MRQMFGLPETTGGVAVMVMPGDNSSRLVHYLAGRFPGKIGWLFSPAHARLCDWMPFAIDNGAYSAWTKKQPWNEQEWMKCLEWVRLNDRTPLWALVPDVVADKDGTIEKWAKYSPIIDRYGWQKAFAVQDGMIPNDVPGNVDVVFVGGTTEWKWRYLPMWCKHFPRIHVGRVNMVHRLWTCESLGVESVDGTGWMRDTFNGGRAKDLMNWMEGFRPQPNTELNFEYS